eukprot:1912399-Amphidinium_carterae.1
MLRPSPQEYDVLLHPMRNGGNCSQCEPSHNLRNCLEHPPWPAADAFHNTPNSPANLSCPAQEDHDAVLGPVYNLENDTE